MAESAFGVDHGEFSKGLNPRNMAALQRLANHGDDANKSMYASAKLQLRGKGYGGMKNPPKGWGKKGAPSGKIDKETMKAALRREYS